MHDHTQHMNFSLMIYSLFVSRKFAVLSDAKLTSVIERKMYPMLHNAQSYSDTVVTSFSLTLTKKTCFQGNIERKHARKKERTKI